MQTIRMKEKDQGVQRRLLVVRIIRHGIKTGN